jgi:hypothetical protein
VAEASFDGELFLVGKFCLGERLRWVREADFSRVSAASFDPFRIANCALKRLRDLLHVTTLWPQSRARGPNHARPIACRGRTLTALAAT